MQLIFSIFSKRKNISQMIAIKKFMAMAFIFFVVFPFSAFATTSEPIYFYSFGNTQAKTPEEIIARENAQPGRNMGVYNACVATVSALPLHSTGGCTVLPFVSIDPDNTYIYNGHPVAYIGHATRYNYNKYSDGTVVSSQQNDAGGAGIVLQTRCPLGMSLKSLPGSSPSITEWCETVDPVRDQCPVAGNPINYLSGDKIQTDIDFEGQDGLLIKRRYLNQRQGWVVDALPRLMDFTGRFSTTPVINDENCLGISATVELQWYDFSLQKPYKKPTYFCLKYFRPSAAYADVVLQADDGLHWDFYNKGTYYAADLYTPHLVALDPAVNNGSAWVLNFNDGKKQFFDQNGLLKKSVENGKEIFYTYQDDKLISKSTKSGVTLTYGYDANGRVSNILLPTGKSILYTYEEPNLTTGIFRLSTVTTADGAKTTYLYENAQFPFALTGAMDTNNVRYATWTYDDQGRATSSQHAGGNDLFTFDYTNLTTSNANVTVTNPLLKKTTYNFSVINGKRLITKVDGVASANCGAANKINEYYPTGLLKSKTDWNGNKTTYIYNAAGQETSRTEGSGSTVAKTITTEWDATLNLKTKVTEPNKETTYSYDANGLLVTQSARTLP